MLIWSHGFVALPGKSAQSSERCNPIRRVPKCCTWSQRYVGP
jgi:hypothetical protein